MSAETNKPWYETFDGAFWLTLAGIVIGFGSVLVNGIIRSRCKTVKCCFGVFTCERDLEAVDQPTDPDTPVIRPPDRELVIR